ncbi:MAG: SBBP repeat-containing protein, partial [Acidobacteriota bacterium]
NYFIGNDPSKWRTNVPHYAKVRYRDVYPGIDLVYYAKDQNLEYDFVVKPAGDPQRIQLAFEGTASVRLSDGGDLIVAESPDLQVLHRRPQVLQIADGRIQHIDASWHLSSAGSAQFNLGEYDRRLSLKIDPVVVYSIPFGGVGSHDQPVGLAVAEPDCLVLVGTTSSVGFPTTSGSFAESAHGAQDVYVSELNADGSALLFSTFLGGSSSDFASAVAVDGIGNIFVSGSTDSLDFPIEKPLQQTKRGLADAFLTKLNSQGNALVYSTYLGGSDFESVVGVQVDRNGNTYVAGRTSSSDFPLYNPWQPELRGGTSVFITKAAPDGGTLVYSTLFGSSQECPSGLALDEAGSVYCSGWTIGPDLPTKNAVQAFLRGSSDAFLSKFSPAGDELVYSTYLGGSQGDVALGIAVDASGSAYLTGSTTSKDFPSTNTLQNELMGEQDVFVTKVSVTGNSLVYSTYLGGSGVDVGSGITVDAAGSASVVGNTFSPDFPTQNSLAIRPVGSRSAFVARLNATGTALLFSTHLDSSDKQFGDLIVGDSRNNLYVSHSIGEIEVGPSPISGVRTTFVPFYAVLSRLTDAKEVEYFLPIVLSASGLNDSFFISELVLTNRSTSNVMMSMRYTSAFGGGSGVVLDSLAPRLQKIIPDTLGYLRSLGLAIPESGDRGGTLVIRFSGISLPTEVGVTVRTINRLPAGSAGVAFSGLSRSMLMDSTCYLFGLRQDNIDRSNVAVQNAGNPEDGDVVLRVSVFSGDPQRPISFTLPDQTLRPGEFQQFNGILRFGTSDLREGYACVQRVGGSAPYYAYAVVNDQETSDGSFVTPVRTNSPWVTTGWMLPAVVETAGFETDVTFANWSNQAKALECSFGTVGGSEAVSIELQPFEQKIIPRFVQFLRESASQNVRQEGRTYVGPLLVVPHRPEARNQLIGTDGIFVGARTRSRTGSKRFGVSYPAEPFSLDASEKWLFGLRQDTESRSNLALINLGNLHTAEETYSVELYDGETGTRAGTIESVSVAARGAVQFNSILAHYAPGTTQGYARIRRHGRNSFLAYAVINDGAAPGERTGDGAFLSGLP